MKDFKSYTADQIATVFEVAKAPQEKQKGFASY